MTFRIVGSKGDIYQRRDTDAEAHTWPQETEQEEIRREEKNEKEEEEKVDMNATPRWKKEVSKVLATIKSWRCPQCNSFYTTKYGSREGSSDLTRRYMRRCKDCRNKYMVEP